MSNYFQYLVNALSKAAERPDSDEEKLRSSAYSAMNTLVHCSAPDCDPYVLHLIPSSLEKLERSLAVRPADNEEQKMHEEMQALLCALLHECVLKLGSKIVENNLADPLMGTILRLFSIKNTAVSEDAFMAVGSVANATEVNFMRYFPHFLPYLTTALQTPADYEVFAIAVGVVGDIARALGQQLTPYCANIINLLVQALGNQDADQSIKSPILSSLGDIAMSIGCDFLPHLPTVMQMLLGASQMKIEDPNDDDENEYINEIRESICEAYTGILQGLRTGNRSGDLIPYVTNILSFMSIAIPEPSKSESLTRGIVGLIGDLAHAVTVHT